MHYYLPIIYEISRNLNTINQNHFLFPFKFGFMLNQAIHDVYPSIYPSGYMATLFLNSYLVSDKIM